MYIICNLYVCFTIQRYKYDTKLLNKIDNFFFRETIAIIIFIYIVQIVSILLQAWCYIHRYKIVYEYFWKICLFYLLNL